MVYCYYLWFIVTLYGLLLLFMVYCYSLWFIVTIYDLLLLFMARLFGPRRRLIQAIEQITGKASSSAATAAAAAAVTVNKQTITSGPANNDIDKISDSEQEHVRLLVCLSLICIILFLNHLLSTQPYLPAFPSLLDKCFRCSVNVFVGFCSSEIILQCVCRRIPQYY